MEHRVSDVGVLDKAVAVLAALEAGPTNLAGLRERTGLPRATAHRLAVALEAHGLVARNGDGQFHLGARLAALGRAAGGDRSLAAVAAPVLAGLRDETGESVQLYVRDGSVRRCVASLDSPAELRTIVPVGAALPLERGSAGRILRGEGAGEAWVASVEEREAGVASVSAPVVGAGGEVVAAVSVSGPVGRLTRQPGKRYGPAVTAAAQAIAAALA